MTETVGGLYIRMGLDVESLQNDYERASEMLKENMEWINRQNEKNPVRIPMKYYIENSSIKDARDAFFEESMAVANRRMLANQKRTVDIYYELGHSDYENELHKLDRLLDNAIEKEENLRKKLLAVGNLTQREINNINEGAAERVKAAIELDAAKRKQLEKEHTDQIIKEQKARDEKVKSLTRETNSILYGLNHSAFEKQLYDLKTHNDQMIEAMREKGATAEEIAAQVANAAAKEAEAFEREVERIKNLTQSLEDEIFEMEHSQYEADQRRALQKAQKALDEGVDPATVQRWLNDKFGKLAERARGGGDYTKSASGGYGDGGPQIIEFGDTANKMKDSIKLFTNEDNIRQRLNQELSNSVDSTQRLINAQDLLTQSLNSVPSVEPLNQHIINFQDEDQYLGRYNGHFLEYEEPTVQQEQRVQRYRMSEPKMSDPYALNPNLPNYQEAIARLMNFDKTSEEAKSTLGNNAEEMAKKIQEATQEIGTFTEKVKPLSSNLEDFNNKLKPLPSSLENFEGGTNKVVSSLQQTAATINEINGKLSNFNVPATAGTPNKEGFDALGATFDTMKVTGALSTLAGTFLPALMPMSGIATTALKAAGLMMGSVGEIGGITNDWFGQDQSKPANMTNSFGNLADFSKIESYLDKICSYQSQIASQKETPNNINVNPTINVSGNVVADEKFIQELSEKIKNEVYTGVTQAVESATRSSSMSYAS